MEQDPFSIEYYDREAESFFQATKDLAMGSLYEPFLALLGPGGRILDAGCGSGRDTVYFLSQGYQVVGFDGSIEMVELASKHTGLPILHRKFSEIAFDQEFDAVWASASLLHVPASQLDDAVRRLSQALVGGGVFYLSFKYGDDEVVKHGRLFNNMNEERFGKLAARHPELRVVRVWKSMDVRPGREDEFWLNALLWKRVNTIREETR